ncbi:MAG TPA: hypothetical protein PLU75_05310 [Oscillospiraceae bacterium]|nr:hypothetical protein [Oscillospiraceae bacterium]HRW57180.1 hypothetical protein [Oscillospiraceae bacterium]
MMYANIYYNGILELEPSLSSREAIWSFVVGQKREHPDWTITVRQTNDENVILRSGLQGVPEDKIEIYTL